MILVYAAFGIITGTMVGLIGLALFYLAKGDDTKTDNLTSAIADATDDSIFVLGRDYRYVFINKNHLLRLGVNDYKGRSYADFHSVENTRGFTAIVDQVFTTGKPILHEHKSERDAGHYLLTLSPVKGADGALAAVTVFSKKITGIKLFEEKLLC